MIKFYWHRGARADALETETLHNNKESVIQLIRTKRPYENAEVKINKLEWWIKDEDYTHKVIAGGYCCGFANIPDDIDK